MSEGRGMQDVGAQDPELKNSPIAEEMDEDSRYLREEVPGESVCYFNGKAYRDGALVKSGESVLRCDSGIWVDVGEEEG